jgi:hypothetical protein
MHFVVSWDISAQGEEWTRINNDLVAVLKPYSWVRPLTTLYVVNVSSQETWNTILAALQSTAQRHGKVNFLMTPLMQGGGYNGFLPTNLWNEINMRSK